MKSSDEQKSNSVPAGAGPIESGPELLSRLGIDATMWCAEMTSRGIVQADPAPGEMFHAWMCNAIMTAYDTGFAAGERRITNDPLGAAAPALMDGCNALLGLIQLVCSRDDTPPAIREALQSSHRVEEARAAIAKAEDR